MNEAKIAAETQRLAALWYARASLVQRLAYLNERAATHNREHRP